MTELEYALERAEDGAKTFLGRYGAPIWGEVDDVFSQARLIALDYLASERYRREHVLYRVFCGLIDWVRYENRRTRPLIRDQEPETVEWNNPDPQEEETLSNREMVVKLVNELDDGDRTIVEAIYWRGEDQKEVAQRLGRSESWLSRKLDAIKSDLRKKIWEIC